jgi:Short C-terminal domain
MAMTPEQEAGYALDYHLPRDSLKPAVQAEYDRQLKARRNQPRQHAGPDAVFPALGVQVRGDSVEAATLRKLASLHNEGLLTNEEYAAKRAEVIARI